MLYAQTSWVSVNFPSESESVSFNSLFFIFSSCFLYDGWKAFSPGRGCIVGCYSVKPRLMLYLWNPSKIFFLPYFKIIFFLDYKIPHESGNESILLFIFKALLRYFSHIMKSTNLKFMIWGYLYIQRIVQPWPQFNFRILSAPRKETSYTLTVISSIYSLSFTLGISSQ